MASENNFPFLMKAFIIITLFSFLLIAVTVQMANNYSKDTTDLEEKLGYNSINNTLTGAKDTAEGWREAFQKQNIFSTIAGIIVTGIFNLANTMFSFITAPFEIFGNIMVNVIGIPAIVLNIVSVMIILTALFGIWRLIKIGR